MTLGKIRLYVRARKQGSRIESVPSKRLIRLSKSRKKSWTFEKTINNDGWLILEAYGWFVYRFCGEHFLLKSGLIIVSYEF